MLRFLCNWITSFYRFSNRDLVYVQLQSTRKLPFIELFTKINLLITLARTLYILMARMETKWTGYRDQHLVRNSLWTLNLNIIKQSNLTTRHIINVQLNATNAPPNPETRIRATAQRLRVASRPYSCQKTDRSGSSQEVHRSVQRWNKYSYPSGADRSEECWQVSWSNPLELSRPQHERRKCVDRPIISPLSVSGVLLYLTPPQTLARSGYPEGPHISPDHPCNSPSDERIIQHSAG